MGTLFGKIVIRIHEQDIVYTNNKLCKNSKKVISDVLCWDSVISTTVTNQQLSSLLGKLKQKSAELENTPLEKTGRT